MELCHATITRASHKSVPWARTAIFPIGDIQLGSDGCAVDELRQWVKRGIALNARFIGMGDYTDVMSPSNRARFVAASLYDSTIAAMEDAARLNVEKLVNIFKGTEGRWFGLIEGHHYTSFLDGTTTDTRLAQALKTEFWGDCAYLTLLLKTAGLHANHVKFVLHHGEGSGATMGAPLNKLERFAFGFAADVFMMGHYHKRGSWPMTPELDSIRTTPHKLKARSRHGILTGSWLRGYEAGHKQAGGARPGGLYPEQKMLSPLPIGAPIVWLEPYHTHDGYGINVRGDA